MRKILMIITLLFFVLLLRGTEFTTGFQTDQKGKLRIGRASFGFTLFNPKWHPFGNEKLIGEKMKAGENGFTLSALLPVNGTDIAFEETATVSGPGRFALHYRLKFPAPFRVNDIRAGLSIPNDLAAVTVDGKRIELPAQQGETVFFSKKEVHEITVDLAPGERLILSPQGRSVSIADGRAYKSDTFSINIPFDRGRGDITNAELSVGFRVEKAVMRPVSVSAAANRSFCDDSAGNGWTGQGPDNDLSMMAGGKIELAPFAFEVIPPAPGTNSAIVLGGATRQLSGREAALKLPEGVRAGAVNLLHAAAWLPLGKIPFGEMEVAYADGSSQTIPVVMYRDCGNWWGANDLPNAKVAWRSENPTSPLGLYASSFALRRDDPREIRFRSTASGGTVWMVAAVTLSNIPVAGNRNTATDVTAAPTAAWPRLAFRDAPVPGSPLDFSWMIDHRPAGKYGFVTASPAGHFAFENAPGKRIRFIGANLCFSANFLPKEETDRLAETFARHGYNSIRLHHIDGELQDWSSPEAGTLKKAELDRLDYLLYALKNRGIYVTFDLYSARSFRRQDNVTADGRAKSLFAIDRNALESWKRYARNLLTHVNPYTGLAWKDDPAVSVVCLVNEGTLSSTWGGAKELYSAAFEKWKAENGCPEARAVNTDRNFLRFLFGLEMKLLEEQHAFLRKKLNMKTLITNYNMGAQENFISLSRDRIDVVDNHVYYAHPSFPEKLWSLPTAYSQTPVTEEMASCPNYIMASRIFGKPFIITEYNFCMPNRSRSAGGPVMGAYAALQDWDGFFRFAWGHHWKRVTENKTAVGFDMAKDPLAWLSDRIAMALFLRGDASPAPERFAYGMGPDHLEKDLPLTYPGRLRRLGLVTQIGTAVSKELPGVQRLTPAQAADPAEFPDRKIGEAWAGACDSNVKLARSTSGEITMDGKGNTFSVVTPRTESLSAASGSLAGKFLAIANADGFTTVAAISLDGEPLAESRSILLLHLTDTTVEGCTFNSTRTLHKAGGTGPLLYRRGRCDITLASSLPFRVTPLSVDGDALAPLTGTVRNGRFMLKADTGSRPGGVFAYHLTR